MGTFSNFHRYLTSSYQNLKSIFTAARKDIVWKNGHRVRKKKERKKKEKDRKKEKEMSNSNVKLEHNQPSSFE